MAEGGDAIVEAEILVVFVVLVMYFKCCVSQNLEI